MIKVCPAERCQISKTPRLCRGRAEQHSVKKDRYLIRVIECMRSYLTMNCLLLLGDIRRKAQNGQYLPHQTIRDM